MNDLRDHRREYESRSITRGDLHPDPMVQFGQWLQQALDIGAIDATAMTLATSPLAPSRKSVATTRGLISASFTPKGAKVFQGGRWRYGFIGFIPTLGL